MMKNTKVRDYSVTRTATGFSSGSDVWLCLALPRVPSVPCVMVLGVRCALCDVVPSVPCVMVLGVRCALCDVVLSVPCVMLC